jgi:hypothetical protein
VRHSLIRLRQRIAGRQRVGPLQRGFLVGRVGRRLAGVHARQGQHFLAIGLLVLAAVIGLQHRPHLVGIAPVGHAVMPAEAC